MWPLWSASDRLMTADDVDRMVDTGVWRQLGYTHWHLTYSEIGTTDRRRYARDRWVELEANPTAVAYDPHEALSWLLDQQHGVLDGCTKPGRARQTAGLVTDADWDSWTLTQFRSLVFGKHAGRGIAIGGGRSAEVFASPMSGQDCPDTHQREDLHG